MKEIIQSLFQGNILCNNTLNVVPLLPSN